MVSLQNIYLSQPQHWILHIGSILWQSIIWLHVFTLTGRYHWGVQLPIAAHNHRDQFLKGSCPWPKTKVKSLKVLIQPRGIGKDTLLLPNLSLNCSCTLQSRDWGMNPGPGSSNKVIKIFQDWLGELHLKSPTGQADVLSHHSAYLEVGSWVSFPPCFEKRSLLHPKEHRGIYMSDLEGECCLLLGHCQTWEVCISSDLFLISQQPQRI